MPERDDKSREIIWMRPAQTSLSRTQIAEAAVTVADLEGVEAVTMRRIAATLGCGTMSLYRHVRTKDDVLDLMIDTVIGESRGWTSELSGDWRADLRVLAWARRAAVLRHPWLAPLLAGRPFMGPNVVANIDLALRTVAGLGLSIDEMVRMISTVDAFVQGFVQIELREREWRHPARNGDTAQDQDPWRAGLADYIHRLIESGDYPHFGKMVIEADDDREPDADFDWQLDRVLDGLAAMVERKRAKAGGGPGQPGVGQGT